MPVPSVMQQADIWWFIPPMGTAATIACDPEAALAEIIEPTAARGGNRADPGLRGRPGPDAALPSRAPESVRTPPATCGSS